jgi:aromatic-L-amino-acid/L-tryptophan decarboxylase
MAVDDYSDGTLDPVDWESYRATGHRILDELIDYLRAAPTGPVWRPVPPWAKDRLTAPAPSGPHDVDAVWDAAKELILPYPTGNIHPRFFGWVHGSGTLGGVFAEMIAATMNCNLGGREHVAVYVERQVIDWWKRVFGFPPEASGLLVTGTSMATVVGLAVARNTMVGFDVRRRGVAAGETPLVAYASAEAHVSVRKALELLGLGGDALRDVPVDRQFRIDPEWLRQMIAEDRRQGRRPFCVVGTSGTVNTGACDDLGAVARVCAAEGLWFHVDGAFGALAALAPTRRRLVDGIERADSLAFDFHKWLHVPYAAGCVLIRDGERHFRTFSTHQSYLARHERGLGGGAPWFCDFGPDLSRSFAALKVWFTIQEHGLDRLGAMIEKNCRQAEYLRELVSRDPRLELMAPVSLNVVCFRYGPPGVDPAALSGVNERIIHELHERGIAAPSSTHIGGALVIRAAITNHRTQRRDLDALAQAVVELGDGILNQ